METVTWWFWSSVGFCRFIPSSQNCSNNAIPEYEKKHLNIGSLQRLFQLIEIDWLIPFFRYITTIIDPIWSLTFLLHPIEPLHPLTDQEVVVSGGLHVAQVAVGGGGGEHPLERTLTTVLVYTLRQHPDVIRRQNVQDGLQDLLRLDKSRACEINYL